MAGRSSLVKAKISAARHGYNRNSVFKRHRSVSIDTTASFEEEGFKAGPILEGTMKIVKKIVGYKDVTCCDTLCNQRLIAVGQSDGTVDIRDIKNCNLVNTLDHGFEEDPKMPVTCLSSNQMSDSHPFLLASYASGYTCLWNCTKFTSDWSINEDRQTLVNRWSPDNTSFAVAGTDNKIMLYDVAKQSLVRTFESSDDNDVMDGHTMRIFEVKFHPLKTREFLSSGWDSTVQFWDIRTPQSIRKIHGPHICGNGIDFMNDGRELLTASWSKTNSLQLWDYGSGQLITDFSPQQYTSYLYCCHYNTTGNFILAGGVSNNMLLVVDVSTRILVANYRNLSDAVLFVQELPPSSPRDIHYKFCIGFGSSIYMMELSL